MNIKPSFTVHVTLVVYTLIDHLKRCRRGESSNPGSDICWKHELAGYPEKSHVDTINTICTLHIYAVMACSCNHLRRVSKLVIDGGWRCYMSRS